ncbi:MAG: hypothetical protein ACXVPD_14650, partial [Bacteroidia bacterium]
MISAVHASFRCLRACAKPLCTFTFVLCTCIAFSQEVEKIKIKKEDPFLKAEFDNTNYKVIALDKYGNPYEEAIKSFAVTFQDTEGKFR